ncbi:hypothetical protein C7212DRAFT_187159, partial [Tuber magnatum]
EPVKLYLPTHEMWWKIPYHLKKVIDGILKMIQQTQAETRKRKVYLSSITCYGIGMPSPERWVLVDLKDGSLVHRNYMESLVYPGGEYIVLCAGATEMPRGLLRQFQGGDTRQGEDGNEGGEYEEVGEDINRVV